MKLSAYVPVYAATLLLSAGLLFSVQPLFSKMILPLLGGTPNVWNTSMLFFQVMLLGGYAYAHATTHYLSIRMQAVLHSSLLIFFTIVLPFAIPPEWYPKGDEDPTLWQLSVMALTVGGPFFVVSGSAPMLQRWFASTPHKDSDNPYFLYGASNLGSMTALLAYPIVAEPLATLSEQSKYWEGGYALLILMTCVCAALAWKTGHKVSVSTSMDAPKEAISWQQRFMWLFLAFVPSSLMLGVTTYITTDIASAPMLWILPLALYVGTFIIVFSRRPLLSIQQVTLTQSFLLIVAIFALVADIEFNHFTIVAIFCLHMGLFFFTALLCHMELASLRPGARRLTEFYLIMSAGGALGGFFNAIIAPKYFVVPVEYTYVLVTALFVRYLHTSHYPLSDIIKKLNPRSDKSLFSLIKFEDYFCIIIVFLFACAAAANISESYRYLCAYVVVAGLIFLIKSRWKFGLMAALCLVLFPVGYKGDFKSEEVVFRDRNFFGVIKVIRNYERNAITLLHGTTTHGIQLIKGDDYLQPLGYYSREAPLFDAIDYLDNISSQDAQMIGAIGLGAGTISCYAKQGRFYDFYEIDPAIAQVAENPDYFRYLSECPDYQIILGDGRMTLQNKPDKSYDLIILDAFSSDNIPVHLLTLEALKLYESKLKERGFIIIHISNRYLDLEPILALGADALEVYAVAKTNDDIPEEKENLLYPSHYVILTKHDDQYQHFLSKGWTDAMRRESVNLWTDQYSNILSVIGNVSGIERLKMYQKEKDAQSKKTP